jgi:hypothetical protein
MIENSDFNKDAFGNTNFDKKKKKKEVKPQTLTLKHIWNG